MLKKIRGLHRNNRGAMAVLVLLTIWGLVVMLAMLWNTAEYGMRRQHVQNAADSAAQASATWLARSLNAVAAQNMVIGQDASAEVIWTAVPPTDKKVRAELEKELALAIAMQNNNDPAFSNSRNAILSALISVDTEYAMTQAQLGIVSGLAGGASFTDPAAALKFKNALRQAPDAMAWVQNTYVNGGAANGVGRPGPPGPAGVGLRDLVKSWTQPQNEQAMLQVIIDTLNKELQIVQQFDTQTAPATAQNVPSQMASHEQQVFQTQQQMIAALPGAIEQQRQQLTDFTHCDLTLATVDADPAVIGPATVVAPIIAAGDVPVSDAHIDSIRVAYPAEAAKEFGTSDPSVVIDPINVHTDQAKIWFPNQDAPVPAELQSQYPGVAATFLVVCTIPDGWGHIWAAPMERYINDRVGRDQQNIRSGFMQPIDDLRQQLAQTLAQMRGITNNVQITDLPANLPDLVPDPQGNPQFEPVLPNLVVPAGASAKLKAEVAAYNQHGAAYTGAVRSLAQALRSYALYFNQFTQPFAGARWDREISKARYTVLKALGSGKGFMVLKSYKLRNLPDWAKDGMSASAEVSIRERIIAMNIGNVTQNVLNAMIKADPQGLGAAYLDPQAKLQVLGAAYSPGAAQIAQAIVRDVATRVAPLIAAEWVARPWPYEITPPEKAVPPARGIGKDDRQHYYTVLAAARTTSDSAPKPFLAAVFTDSKNLVAYAQAEAFNWMEFSGSYGGADRYDEVSQLPSDRDWWGPHYIGVPRCWRLSTVGGWNWQSKLAMADALAPAMAVNQEFTGYFSDAGVTAGSAGSDVFTPVNLH